MSTKSFGSLHKKDSRGPCEGLSSFTSLASEKIPAAPLKIRTGSNSIRIQATWHVAAYRLPSGHTFGHFADSGETFVRQVSCWRGRSSEAWELERDKLLRSTASSASLRNSRRFFV